MGKTLPTIAIGAIDMNNDKLLKLLMMTTSSNDNEALVAIRLANKQVKSWEVILNTGPIRPTNEALQYKDAYNRAIREKKHLEIQVNIGQAQLQAVHQRLQSQVMLVSRYEEENIKLKKKLEDYNALPGWIKWVIKKFY